MIAYIDTWLGVWGEWSAGNSERLGHSSQTPIHKMMTTNAATTSKLKYRRQRQLIRIGNRYFERHIEPMRGKESVGKRVILTADNPIAEAIDKAIAQLREERLKKAVIYKYLLGFNNKTSAAMMKMDARTFERRVNLAHYCLDMYLHLKYPELIKNLNPAMQLDKSGRLN